MRVRCWYCGGTYTVLVKVTTAAAVMKWEKEEHCCPHCGKSGYVSVPVENNVLTA